VRYLVGITMKFCGVVRMGQFYESAGYLGGNE